MATNIQQQMYTRAQRPLFGQGEGYGTVAATPGLDSTFIKEKIHPYCTYPTLWEGEKPTVTTLVNYPCGRMLLGRAVYKPKDFTGQRTTFFAHNYILPPRMAVQVFSNVGKLQGIKYFAEESELLELCSLPCAIVPAGGDDIANDFIEKIAECVEASVFGAGKVYVVLREFSHSHIWEILARVYGIISPEARQLLGFCTFANTTIDKEGIHLAFVPPGFRARNNDYIVQENALPVVKPVSRLVYPPKRFFAEAELLHIRGLMPFAWESEWIDTNLDKLTLAQLAAVPDKFLQRGKTSDNPRMYVMLGIAKSFASMKPVDIRYFLGSYNLANEEITRLRRIFERIVV